MKIKRFVAYSSTNHMGFLLTGLTLDSVSGQRITLLYLVIYIIMSFCFFSILISTHYDCCSLIYMGHLRELLYKNNTFR